MEQQKNFYRLEGSPLDFVSIRTLGFHWWSLVWLRYGPRAPACRCHHRGLLQSLGGDSHKPLFPTWILGATPNRYPYQPSEIWTTLDSPPVMLFSSSAGGGLIAFSGLRIAMDSCIVAGGGLISKNHFYLEVGNGMFDVCYVCYYKVQQ